MSLTRRGLWPLLFLALAHAAAAQDALPVYTSISAGPSITTGTAGALGGVHLALAVESGAPGAVSLRIEGMVVASAAATAQPSCTAGPCESFSDPYPAQLYSGSLVLVAPIGPRGFYMLGGGGAYYGAGNKSTKGDKFGTTGGASFGFGIATGSSRLRLELRYHYLMGGLGRLRGVVVPSVSVRF